MSLKLDSVLKILIERYENIPYHKVYFSLKEWGIKNIRGKSSVNIIRACIAIETMGLPEITSRLISACCQIPIRNISEKLHNLGDQKVLLCKRKRLKTKPTELYSWVKYSYKLNPPFKKLFFGEKTTA